MKKELVYILFLLVCASVSYGYSDFYLEMRDISKNIMQPDYQHVKEISGDISYRMSPSDSYSAGSLKIEFTNALEVWGKPCSYIGKVYINADKEYNGWTNIIEYQDCSANVDLKQVAAHGDIILTTADSKIEGFLNMSWDNLDSQDGSIWIRGIKDDTSKRVSLLEQWKNEIENHLQSIKSWLYYYPSNNNLCEAVHYDCGIAIPPKIKCSNDAGCGANGYVGDNYCNGNAVYRLYKTYTCNAPGTEQSYCSDSTTPILIQNCGVDETCQNGACVSIAQGTVIFRTNANMNVQGDCNSFTRGNAWISYDIDRDGELEGLSNYGSQSNLCNNKLLDLPNGCELHVIKRGEVLGINQQNSCTKFSIRGAHAGDAVLETYPIEPYTSNNQEVYS